MTYYVNVTILHRFFNHIFFYFFIYFRKIFHFSLFQPLLPQGVSSRRASGSRLSRHEVPFKAMKVIDSCLIQFFLKFIYSFSDKFLWFHKKFIQIRSNTLSVLHDGSQANQVVYTYRRAEKNDPCFLKIQFMLVQVFCFNYISVYPIY